MENQRGEVHMTEPERVGPGEIYEKLKAGAALLVCAYEELLSQRRRATRNVLDA
jgi:hypothetical protein